jgi:hypothetical protein
MSMRKCGSCQKDLTTDGERFCDNDCRLRFIDGLRKGTPSHPGRRVARRLRRRGG